MIRLVCSDLDGTLLKNGIVPTEAFDIILKLKSIGIHFASTSGREYSNQQRLFLPIQDQIEYVTCNGGICVVNGQVTDTITISPELVPQIIAEAQSHSMNLLLSGAHTTYILDCNRAFSDAMIYDIRNTTTIIHSFDDICEPVVKIAAQSPRLSEFSDELLAKWSTKVTATVSGSEWFDWTAANKGMGVKILMERLNVTPDETAGFGDYFNDETFLATVGHPFIMRNAPEAMKKPNYTLCDDVVCELKKLLSSGGEHF